MSSSTTVRLSAVVMHHPARSERIPKLLRGCAPLVPRVIHDPDPTGPPSPLRTAKRAWAAIEPEATHHLVLQDDVLPAPGFARHLLDVVRQRPHDAIALYVNWNSPLNSYIVRRTVAAGSPWAPLSPTEWTPTLGLVLPAARARELAAHLATLPDTLRADDEMVSAFMRQRGISVVAAVPHLLEHGSHASVAGNDAHGPRLATVFAGDCPPSAGHWSAGLDVDPALAEGRGHHSPSEFAVEIIDSTCLIRFVRPATGEPMENPWFGWYWADWCSFVGVKTGDVVNAWEALLRSTGHLSEALRDVMAGLGACTVLEFWAACYLLGADISVTDRETTGGMLAEQQRRSLLRGVLRSWLDSGLTLSDRRLLTARSRDTLIDAGMEALVCGRSSGLVKRLENAGRHRVVTGIGAMECMVQV